MPRATVFDRDFYSYLLILKHLSVNLYPTGVSKNFFNYFPGKAHRLYCRWLMLGNNASFKSNRRSFAPVAAATSAQDDKAIYDTNF
jgi:hypothetical protein